MGTLAEFLSVDFDGRNDIAPPVVTTSIRGRTRAENDSTSFVFEKLDRAETLFRFLFGLVGSTEIFPLLGKDLIASGDSFDQGASRLELGKQFLFHGAPQAARQSIPSLKETT